MKHKAYMMAISHLSVTECKNIWSSDNYLPLLFHVGTSDTVRRNQRSIKDYRAVIKHSGTQAVFTSIFPVIGKGWKGLTESGESSNGYRTVPHRGLAT